MNVNESVVLTNANKGANADRNEQADVPKADCSVVIDTVGGVTGQKQIANP